MLKKICLILISVITLNANEFNDKIINIIGYSEYNENRGLIEHLFSNKSWFYKNGQLNYLTVMEKLKANGLLKVGLNKPQNITITFQINNSPIKSLKIISNSLNALGYYYYFTKNLTYDKNKNITWIINLKTETAIDPYMLAKELAKHDCEFIDIRKINYTEWKYSINTSNSILPKAKNLTLNENIDFRKPLSPYLIKIDDKAKKIDINSRTGNKWFPHIVFYDKNLNILNIVKEDKKSKSLQLEIPEETSYIKIDDLYTLANIKRGLSVSIKE